MRIVIIFCVFSFASSLRIHQQTNENVYTNSCLSNDGQWIDDAHATQYPTTTCDSNEMNSKSWQSIFYKWVPNCRPLELLNKDTFCSAMKKHQFTRIIQVGDSIQHKVYFSLQNLVDGGKTFHECPGRKARFDVQCSHGNIAVLMESSEDLKASKWADWGTTYKESDDATLVLYNMGVHQHSVEDFQNLFNEFMAKATESVKTRPKDMFMYRTTNKGHDNCETHSKPLTLDEVKVQQNTTKWQYWNLFPAYNAYVSEKLTALPADLKPHFSILDTSLMFAMRPDGHLMENDGMKTRYGDNVDLVKEDLWRGVDCLHYRVPGVPDWNNHLFVSRLMELPKAS